MSKRTRAVSSGGVVYRPGVTGPEVLVLRRAPSGRWRLPKGGVESGEGLEEAALREVAEEAGVQAEVLAHNDEAKQACIDKTVHHFLMRAEEGAAVALEPGTFDAGGFYPLQQAMAMLHFDNEREAVREATELINAFQDRRPE